MSIRGVEVQLYSFFNIGARWRWLLNATPRPLYSREREPVSIVQEAGWAPGPVWAGAENLAPTGIRSPERPARSELLYRLSYPGQTRNNCCSKDATMHSVCIVGNIQVAVNNIKPLSGAMERTNGFPLHCCRDTKYFLLLSTVQTYLCLHVQCQILLSALIKSVVSRNIFVKSSIPNFTKIRPMGASFIHAA